MSQLPEGPSPLVGDNLTELFSKDPFKYTSDDITQIVSVLRQKRNLWAQEELAKQNKVPRAKAQPKLTKEEKRASLDLGDIDLD